MGEGWQADCPPDRISQLEQPTEYHGWRKAILPAEQDAAFGQPFD